MEGQTVSPLKPPTKPVAGSLSGIAQWVARREPFFHNRCHALILPRGSVLEDVGTGDAATLRLLNTESQIEDLYVMVASNGAPLAWVSFKTGARPRTAPDFGTTDQAKRVSVFCKTLRDYPEAVRSTPSKVSREHLNKKVNFGVPRKRYTRS